LREVCRSRPAFGKQLLFASVLFTGLFVADLFVLGHLWFGTLSRQVIGAAFMASLDALRQRPIPPGPVLPLEAPLPFHDGECPLGDPVSTEGAVPRPAPAGGGAAGRVTTVVGGLFRALSVRIERALLDTRGNVLWRDFRQGSLFDPQPRPERRHPAGESDWAHEAWRIEGRDRRVVAFTQPADPASGVVREVGIPEELIDQEIVALQRDLQTKLWVGAIVAVVILAIAFLYALHLLRRTRQLEAQAQMDDRLAYVGGLAAGLAHEIRNPLNVLSMNLQMLEEDVVARLGDRDSETRHYLATLQTEIRRLGSLVDNFLSYARPTRPRFEARDFNEVIAATCRLVKPQFEAQQVVLRQELAPFLPAAEIDESQIRQALMNILMNAVQILGPGGTVLVQSGVVPDGGVQVTVTDDGPGIAPVDRERIFDVFYSNRPGGTGLGLAIAARIMHAHGGQIRVEDGPGGRGARFVLRVPRRQPAEAAAAAPGAVAVPGKS
jgi:signal transduction histidine kinase